MIYLIIPFLIGVVIGCYVQYAKRLELWNKECNEIFNKDRGL